MKVKTVARACEETLPVALQNPLILLGYSPIHPWGNDMNKYLMLTAAALLVSASGASANQKTISFDGFCDGMQIGWQAQFYGETHLYSGCGYFQTDVSISLAGRTKGIGDNVSFQGTYQPYFGLDGELIAFDIQLPLKTGNSFTLYSSQSGVVNSGTYTVEKGATVVPTGKTSTFGKVHAAHLRK
jgi:hypothetical protein